jgi:hypothetical protein
LTETPIWQFHAITEKASMTNKPVYCPLPAPMRN